MLYCSNGTDFTEVWEDEGINPCFINTITSAVLFTFMFVCGCIQCSMYRKYSSSVDEKFVNTNFGTVLQMLLTCVLILESAGHVISKDLLKENGGVAGVDLLVFLCLFISWFSSLRLLSLERKQLLPTIPTRGHGLVLLVFWALAFLRENLAFISWWSHNWWWYFIG